MVSVHSDYSDVSASPPPKPFPLKRLRVGIARATSGRVQSVRPSSSSLVAVPAAGVATPSPSPPPSQATTRPASECPGKPVAHSDRHAAGTASVKEGKAGRVLLVEINGEFDNECSSELRAPYVPTGVDMGDLAWGGMERRRLALAK